MRFMQFERYFADTVLLQWRSLTWTIFLPAKLLEKFFRGRSSSTISSHCFSRPCLSAAHDVQKPNWPMAAPPMYRPAGWEIALFNRVLIVSPFHMLSNRHYNMATLIKRYGFRKNCILGVNGAYRTRTDDFLHAMQALSQLS